MKIVCSTALALAAVLCAAVGTHAAESPATPAGELKDLRLLPPEEREARMKEFHEKRSGHTNSAEFQKRMEEFRNLPPEEREAKMKEMRAKFGEMQKRREEFKSLPPEKQEELKRAMREKLESSLADLRQRKEAGTLKPDEERRLQKMEGFLRHMKERREGTNTASEPKI